MSTEYAPLSDDSCPLDISDDDVIEAMKSLGGYVDITPSDFKEIYRLAFNHAFGRLNQSRTAEDVMTRRVISVKQDTALVKIADKMSRHRISGVPVINDRHEVVGLISENDFLAALGANGTSSFMGLVATCLEGSGCLALPIRSKTAADIMTTPPITITPRATVADIASLFATANIKRVPVVDQHQILSGIVTRTDLVQSYCLKTQS